MGLPLQLEVRSRHGLCIFKKKPLKPYRWGVFLFWLPSYPHYRPENKDIIFFPSIFPFLSPPCYLETHYYITCFFCYKPGDWYFALVRNHFPPVSWPEPIESIVSHVRLWEHEGESFIFCSGTDAWVTNRSSTICVLLIGNHIFTWNMHIDTNSARRAFLGRGRTATDTRFSLWIAWWLSLNLKNALILMFNCEFLVTSD